MVVERAPFVLAEPRRCRLAPQLNDAVVVFSRLLLGATEPANGHGVLSERNGPADAFPTLSVT